MVEVQDDQSDSSPTRYHYREVCYFHLGTLAAQAQVNLQVICESCLDISG